MSIEEAKKFLAAKLECIEQRTNPSGCDDDCEACSLCYAQGTMGDQIEALRIAIKALEHEPMHEEIDTLKQMLVELVEGFRESTLDKIRDEIAGIRDKDPEEDYQYGYNDALRLAAHIVNKYKARI